ncbi:MAG: hypothetical protein FJZ90_11510, partial [Chloroflexi bacterium]|nr:hypothetical protein [Chloroflexota bacterium]
MDSEGSTVAQAADLSVGSDRPLLRRVARSTMTLAERRLLLILVDLLLINASLALAASIWSYFEFTSSYLQFTAKWFITLSVLWLVLGSALGIYNLARAGSITSGLYSSVTAALVISLVYRAIPWLTPPAEPRMLSFGFVGFSVASIALWRAAYALLLVQLAFERRALVIGSDATTHRLASELGAAADDERANPYRGSGYRVIGVLDDLPLTDDGALDPTHSFLRLIAERQVDEILVSESNHLSQPMQ